MATLESRRCAAFAVPSKVLSYLCAGRPILIAAPRSNLAAEVVQRSGGGAAFDPTEDEKFLRTALELSTNDSERARLGTNARQYAEREFDIQAIAAKFEAIIARAARKPLSRRRQSLPPFSRIEWSRIHWRSRSCWALAVGAVSLQPARSKATAVLHRPFHLIVFAVTGGLLRNRAMTRWPDIEGVGIAIAFGAILELSQSYVYANQPGMAGHSETITLSAPC